MNPRLLALALLVGGCDLISDSFVTNDFSGDPYPILVESDSGAIVVGIREQGLEDRVALLDLLSPVTIVDPGPDIAPLVTSADLTILGLREPGGALDLPRAHLEGARTIEVHPCATDGCSVGVPATPRPYGAIIGADVLAGDAVRLRLGDHQISILADVGGDESDRAYACDAVFPSPYRGGGTLVIAGTELAFGGRRITLQSCLGANPDPDVSQAQRGADALLVASTGLGITLLGAAAYERYRIARPGAPAIETLPEDTVLVASGPITGRRTTIDRLALDATSSTTPRAPSRAVFGHHLLTERNCNREDDCICEEGDTFCAVPGVVELAPPAGIELLVIGDDEPLLQALRTELRPDQAEVDGILGTTAMRSAELDIDYPHDRMLARCTAAGCSARPALPEARDRDHVQACIALTP
ncbi:MAG: hypothetical protein WKG01_19560 [Kofleriaceae bacterium]